MLAKCKFSLVLIFAALFSTAVANSDGSHGNRKKRAVASLGDLEVVVQQLSQRVEQLSASLIGINDELQAKITSASQKRHALEDTVNNFIQSANSTRTPTVRFFFKYTPDLFSNMTLNQMQNMTFNTEVTNEGQGYAKGVFTAPVSGTYVFFLNAAATPGHADVMQLNLMKQVGESLCGARTTNFHDSNSHANHNDDKVATGSCQAVVKLSMGESVYVQNLWDDAKYWGGLTTLGGFLLHV